jgi:hypothetical protein
MTIDEIIDESMTFRPDVLRAMREFRRSKPWRGTFAERCEKFERLNREIAEAYGMQPPVLILPESEDHAAPGNGGVGQMRDGRMAIGLSGHLSVITYLRMFAYVRGCDEERAIRWSVNLFRRVFPRSFAGCRLEPDGRLVKAVPVVRMPAGGEIGMPRIVEG